MNKRVFISYATADERIVSLFEDSILHEGSGVSANNIIWSRPKERIDDKEDRVVVLRERLSASHLFIMMVSEAYRNSAVCLNEMGAMLVLGNVPIIVVVLPDVKFDRMGLLNDFRGAIPLTDSASLDVLHDRVMEILDTKVDTLTWNKNKHQFFLKLQDIVSKGVSVANEGRIEVEDEMDLLDLREQFAVHTKAYVECMNRINSAVTGYSGKIRVMTEKLQQVSDNPKEFTADQLRMIFRSGAEETEALSVVLEQSSPEIKEHFDLAMKYAIILQSSSTPNEVKQANRKACQCLIDGLIELKDVVGGFRTSLNDLVDIDKQFTKSKNRLMLANDQLLEVVAFCISRANEYRQI